MEFSHPNVSFQARTTQLRKQDSPLKRILKNDPAIPLQILLCTPVIAAGILLNINFLQWILVGVVTLLFLVAGFFRTAAILQVRQDREMTPFHLQRVQTMGNALVTLAAAISLITYLLVFVPMINQLV
jgi:hypothetical protein